MTTFVFFERFDGSRLKAERTKKGGYRLAIGQLVSSHRFNEEGVRIPSLFMNATRFYNSITLLLYSFIFQHEELLKLILSSVSQNQGPTGLPPGDTARSAPPNQILRSFLPYPSTSFCPISWFHHSRKFSLWHQLPGVPRPVTYQQQHPGL